MLKLTAATAFSLAIALSSCANNSENGQSSRPLLSDALCAPAECAGPSPLAPNYECDDSSIAGPACVDTEGTCGWQVLQCDETITGDTCTVAQCGIGPGAPNYLCEDGSVAGPSCGPSADGTCGWQILSCPSNPTEPTDPPICVCDGPAPLAPNFLCEDGQSFSGPVCVQTNEGCSWNIVDCPAGPPPVDACTVVECGIAPGAPNYLCDDGSTGGPTCRRGDNGQCGWQDIACTSI